MIAQKYKNAVMMVRTILSLASNDESICSI